MEEFDQIVQQPNDYYQEGFHSGLQDGLKAQSEMYKKEAYENGQEIGDELGYYLGLIISYRALYQQIVDSKKHKKILNIMNETQKMIEIFNIEQNNPKKMQEEVTKIRAQIKLLAIYMGMKYSIEQ